MLIHHALSKHTKNFYEFEGKDLKSIIDTWDFQNFEKSHKLLEICKNAFLTKMVSVHDKETQKSKLTPLTVLEIEILNQCYRVCQ